MTTQAQLEVWMRRDDRLPVVLVEASVRVAGVETTRYLTDKAYSTGAADAPANIAYLPVVSEPVKPSEKLALDGYDGPSNGGAASLTTGALMLNNKDGSLDGWLNDVWVNRPVRVFVGDARWARADFYLIFDGITADLDLSGRDSLMLQMTDKLQRLNAPLSETKVGGTGENKDALIPQVLGECHNVEPLLVDAAQHQYALNPFTCERIIEGRDNGAPVSITPVLSSAQFRLNQSPVGQITASVQGDKQGGVYVKDVAGIVQRLATLFGKVSERFTNADLDTASLAAFAAANPQTIGLFVPDRMNVLEAIRQAAASVGAQVVMTRTGKLRLVKLALPPTGTPRAITEADYEQFTLAPRPRSTVRAGVKLGFCRNWTVQNNLQTGVPEAHKTLFGQEWLTVSATDATVAANYRLHSDPEQEETLLQVRSEAQAEADRRLALWKVPRYVYQMVCFPDFMTLQLGDAVTIYNSRYGLAGGKLGMVVGLETDWLAGRVTVEVLI
jgi:hypothetical protein